jgi:hypothetical protein
MLSLHSIDEKSRGQGKLFFYDRELRTEVASMPIIAVNLQEVQCPETTLREQDVTFRDGRKIRREVEQRFFVYNEVGAPSRGTQ